MNGPQDGFKVFICHYSLQDFFVFESYIFEERCEWPLARDQQKAGKRIRHVEKKSEAVCVVVTLLPRKIDVFSKKKNCVSTLHVIKGKELRRPDKQTAGFLFQQERKKATQEDSIMMA